MFHSHIFNCAPVNKSPSLFFQIKPESLQGTDQCAIRNGFGEFDIAEFVEVNNQSATITRNHLVSRWGVILAQFGLHAVELSNVGFFECSGFFASEAHNQENEAVFGDLVHWEFAPD
ncbi:Uncharacterised protein [Shigella sonnei]|nr:Uncharacterised protein [Shigella sonnei]